MKLRPGERSVILKIHGAVDRAGGGRVGQLRDHRGSLHRYLTRTEIQNLVPVMLAMQLRRSHFLFLGYSMRDWNLRVILHRIWGEQKLKYKSWAIQRNPDKLEREFWGLRGVDVHDVPLEEYVPALEAALAELQQMPAGP
jgi:hypothetical protein